MPRRAPSIIRSSIGPLVAWWDQDGSLRVEWGERTADNASAREVSTSLLERIGRAASGRGAGFEDVPTPAGTPFQRRCWDVARRIPPGETLSYGEVAKRAGNPGAARAVGQAMRRNPIPIIVPCHRVVARGGLGGYAGTANATDPRCVRKSALLALERGARRPGSSETGATPARADSKSTVRAPARRAAGRKRGGSRGAAVRIR